MGALSSNHENCAPLKSGDSTSHLLIVVSVPWCWSERTWMSSGRCLGYPMVVDLISSDDATAFLAIGGRYTHSTSTLTAFCKHNHDRHDMLEMDQLLVLCLVLTSAPYDCEYLGCLTSGRSMSNPKTADLSVRYGLLIWRTTLLWKDQGSLRLLKLVRASHRI